MLTISLQRNPTQDETTEGVMTLDDPTGFTCVTLEDAVRDLHTDGSGKVYGKTAIPAGRYKVDITFSQKFQKMMLGVEGVPFFTGIRIHSGNDADDTLGCILVGQHVDSSTHIHGGSIALPNLHIIVGNALSRGEEVWLEIHDAA